MIPGNPPPLAAVLSKGSGCSFLVRALSTATSFQAQWNLPPADSGFVLFFSQNLQLRDGILRS
jgi:hypothetical protein